MQNTWKRIPAYGAKTGRRNVLHLLTMERPNQRRDVPLLSPVIETLKQLGRYTDAELTAAVISGMFSVFIKTEDPQNPLGESAIPYSDQIDTQDENSYEMGAGAIMALEPNQSIEIANPGRPNTAFDGFITSLARQIGVALELPYELLIKHFTASYSASRAALLEAWKMFRMKRVWLASNFCQPIYEEWLTEAILKGRIEAKGFFDDPAIKQAWCGVEWVGPSQGQIDPIKEANAAKIRVEQGFSTREREAMELTGGNFSIINKVRIKEERLRREGELVTDNNGLPIGTAEDIANKNANIANNEVQAKFSLTD
jgi:lambda family phage portal protein